MDYKYTELDYARTIYEKGFQSAVHRPTELRLVATYLRRILDYKPKRLREEMYHWSEMHIPGYQKELYYKNINKAINQACKKDSALLNVPDVTFFQYELDYINRIRIFENPGAKETSSYEYECRKVLFTLLFLWKVNQYIAEKKSTRGDFEYQGLYFKGGQKKYSELKKLAKLPEKIRINEDIIHTLWVNGLVIPMYQGLIKMSFLEKLSYIKQNQKADTPVIQIHDFDFPGWYFDYFNGDTKISFCRQCGKIFKKRGANNIYCKDCSDSLKYYSPIHKKVIICEDCGKEITIEGIVKNKKRCKNCQSEYIRKYDRERKRK